MGVNRKIKLHNYNKKRLHLVPEDVDHEWQKKRKDLLLNHNALELENGEEWNEL